MKMLFCSDGSPAAENAVRFGALVAAACRAEATILGVSETDAGTDSLVQSLRRSQELLQQSGLDVELVTKAGRPVVEIVARTRATRYDLVVIAAERRRSTGPFRRSVRAYRIIEAVEPPVLVVMGERTALRRILLCTGGVQHRDATVELAGELARQLPAQIDLFHVLAEPPALYADLIAQEETPEGLLRSDTPLGQTLAHQKAVLEQKGVTCEIHLRHGLVMAELLAELRQYDHDLIVAGSAPARERLRRYMLGDLAREIVNHADRPVLIVRSVGITTELRHRLTDWAIQRLRGA